MNIYSFNIIMYRCVHFIVFNIIYIFALRTGSSVIILCPSLIIYRCIRRHHQVNNKNHARWWLIAKSFGFDYQPNQWWSNMLECGGAWFFVLLGQLVHDRHVLYTKSCWLWFDHYLLLHCQISGHWTRSLIVLFHKHFRYISSSAAWDRVIGEGRVVERIFRKL
jgi:hypothetical protein